MRLAIVGAGATGGYLGGCLARAGADVVLVARGPHLAAMRERGLTVREPDGSAFTTHPECTDDLGGAVGSAEAVLVTLKAHSLPGVAEALGTALRPGASVVFAQNGIPWWYAEGLETVDPGGAIAAHIPKEAVLGCVVYPATSLAEPGVVVQAAADLDDDHDPLHGHSPRRSRSTGRGRSSLASTATA